MTTNAIEVEEGDPNGQPWRNRPGGPQLEWVYAADLQPGDRVMMGSKYMHHVAESAAAGEGLWKLVFRDPEVAPTSDRGPEKISAAMPQRREWLLKPDMPYRRVVG